MSCTRGSSTLAQETWTSTGRHCPTPPSRTWPRRFAFPSGRESVSRACVSSEQYILMPTVKPEAYLALSCYFFWFSLKLHFNSTRSLNFSHEYLKIFSFTAAVVMYLRPKMAIFIRINFFSFWHHDDAKNEKYSTQLFFLFFIWIKFHSGCKHKTFLSWQAFDFHKALEFCTRRKHAPLLTALVIDQRQSSRQFGVEKMFRRVWITLTPVDFS